jgi:hypothetical protein
MHTLYYFLDSSCRSDKSYNRIVVYNLSHNNLFYSQRDIPLMFRRTPHCYLSLMVPYSSLGTEWNSLVRYSHTDIRADRRLCYRYKSLYWNCLNFHIGRDIRKNSCPQRILVYIQKSTRQSECHKCRCHYFQVRHSFHCSCKQLWRRLLKYKTTTHLVCYRALSV